MSLVRVFIASSLDGFIAGSNDELDWLPHGEGMEDTFTPFMKQIGALLMGRRTFDVASGFEGEWPYGETPVVVATRRPLASRLPSVISATGSIEELVQKAKELAGGRDVYIDGGTLIRSALDAGLIDEIIVTMIPTVLGAGIPLFAGTARRHPLELVSQRDIGLGLVELRYVPKR